jgi:phospholipid transport system substrate-binding protein
MKRRFIGKLVGGLIAVTLMAGGAFAQAAEEAPDALVKRLSTDVLETIKADKTIAMGDTAKVVSLVETKVMPHLNFERMTASAVGPTWRQATPEQKKRLQDEFKTLLVRTYSGALANFRNNTIDVRPLRMQATDTDVTVKTVINQANGQGIPIDYSLEKQADGSWKAYDIVVGGVSLVTNYRDEFNTVIRDQGVDALIKQLQSKNK